MLYDVKQLDVHGVALRLSAVWAHLWRLHLDDKLDSIDVQAARSHICGHQDVEFGVPERLESCLHREGHLPHMFALTASKPSIPAVQRNAEA